MILTVGCIRVSIPEPLASLKVLELMLLELQLPANCI